MSRMQWNVALIVLLAAAANVGGVSGAHEAGWLVFGIANVLITARGTKVVRWLTVAAATIVLAFPELPPIGTVIAWLVWLPAFFTAWAMGRADGQVTARQPLWPVAPERLKLAALILAVALGVIAYRLIVWGQLGQTAALFVGIPTLLAIVVTLMTSPQSATGVACKAVTIGLLVSMVLLGEGMLCVLMSAPLFYLVAVAVGSSVNLTRRAFGQASNRTLTCLTLLAILPWSLEGVTGTTTVNRESAVTVTRVVAASPEAVRLALAQPPRFDRTLPPYLRAGFPWPEYTRIEGDRWIVRMRGGEMRLNGMEHRAGDLVLQLEDAGPDLVRWRALSDDSHMTHFLRWRESIVRLAADESGGTRVTWTIAYSRDLDPSWYFGWWERYAATLAADYLIDAVATP